MHISVVNFNLEGISHDDFLNIAEEVAPAFAQVDGLISKVWLSDKERNTYGGVYTWENKEALDACLVSDLFSNAVINNPNFVNVSVKDFDVLKEPSKVTGIK